MLTDIKGNVQHFFEIILDEGIKAVPLNQRAKIHSEFLSIIPEWEKHHVKFAQTEYNWILSYVQKFFQSYYEKGIFLPVHRENPHLHTFFPLIKEDFDVYWTSTSKSYFIHRHLDQFFQDEMVSFFQGLKGIDGKRLQGLWQLIEDLSHGLSQIEMAKQIVWEQPKKVSRINYCISLSLVPPTLFREILQCRAQWEEWSQIFPHLKWMEFFNEVNEQHQIKIKEKVFDQISYPYLPIDTRFFSAEFTKALVKGNPELETNPDGILIKGENWQALNYLKATYTDAFRCIYIDPPYNTGNDDFLFLDKYPHFTWLAMMENRLQIAKTLLHPKGMFYCSIDDNEQALLKLLVDHIFGSSLPNIIWHKKTQPSFLTKELIPVTEYILAAKKSAESIPLWGAFGDKEKLTELINISNHIAIRTMQAEHVIIANGWTGTLQPGLYGKDKLQVELMDPITVTEGKADHDFHLRSRFKWIQDRIDAETAKGGIIHIKSIKSLRPTIARAYDTDIVRAPTTLLSKKVDDFPTNTDGNREMKDFFGISPFDYPKPTALIKHLIASATYYQSGPVLDFFGGSGTTAQACIELNQADGGHRQFVLIEKGDHFTTVLLPRLKKVMFSDTWQDGKPQSPQGSQLKIKYIELETYESLISQ